MTVPDYVPARTDVVWLNFNPQAGREQAGHRPGLVLSPERYNRRLGFALICPITSQAKGFPFEVSIPEGLPVKGVILADHVKSLDWRVRNLKFICNVPEECVAEVIEKLLPLLEP